ncbi:MAG: DUF916 domain-containing protein [Bifidobacteriaceae bacterium]|jgi:hypothetical protein|nr:DUF916 domain-containing protein [Bifidobacteriaceae bacterium]
MQGGWARAAAATAAAALACALAPAPAVAAPDSAAGAAAGRGPVAVDLAAADGETPDPSASSGGAGGADGSGRVRWSVAPAGPDGRPDGRRWFELALEPGERAEESLAVTNLSDRPVVFGLEAADGFFNEGGRFGMAFDAESSVGAGRWVGVRGEVEVGAGETVAVPFWVDVPANAEPGDWAAGIAAVLEAGAGGGETGVGIASRVGVRVLVRVSGELAPSLRVSGLEASYVGVWDLRRPGSVAAGFDLVNTGNTRLTVTGRVSAGGGAAALFPAEGEPALELWPGASRRVEVALDGVWPKFRVPVVVEADPVAVLTASGGTAPEVAPVAAEATVWAVPWPHLALAGGLALLVGALVARRARSRRRTQALVARARAEGAAAALAGAQAGAQAGGGPAGGLRRAGAAPGVSAAADPLAQAFAPTARKRKQDRAARPKRGEA